MSKLKDRLCELNHGFAGIGLNVKTADQFICERIAFAVNILKSMENVLSSGYVSRTEVLLAARELLSSIGEMHSAFNSAIILESLGYSATFVDLSGWQNIRERTIDQRIHDNFHEIEPSKTICFATGYTKGTEGIMREFDRGWQCSGVVRLQF